MNANQMNAPQVREVRRHGEARGGRGEEQGAADRAGHAREDLVPVARQQPRLVSFFFFNRGGRKNTRMDGQTSFLPSIDLDLHVCSMIGGGGLKFFCFLGRGWREEKRGWRVVRKKTYGIKYLV